jgi:hypothetical protein
MCRSEPQMLVAVILMTASVGCSTAASATCWWRRADEVVWVPARLPRGVDRTDRAKCLWLISERAVGTTGLQLEMEPQRLIELRELSGRDSPDPMPQPLSGN